MVRKIHFINMLPSFNPDEVLLKKIWVHGSPVVGLKKEKKVSPTGHSRQL
ncbi:hypothetical protein [Mucilaginibacter paludis]|nr:hypothetical protein [Mucilaginibacter paludis]